MGINQPLGSEKQLPDAKDKNGDENTSFKNIQPFPPKEKTPTSKYQPNLDYSITQVKSKVKTRGIAAANFIISKNCANTATVLLETKEKIRLPSTITKVFKKIFDTSTDRAGIPWSAFLTAMSSAGFSITPIGGSAFRFFNKDWGCMNVHRPHPDDRIEGFAALKLRGRLARRFGWGLNTFVGDKIEVQKEPKSSNQRSSRKGKAKLKGKATNWKK